MTKYFKVGLHQGSALIPFWLVLVIDRMPEDIRQKSPLTMMFSDDFVNCSESREQVEEQLERWRSLKSRGTGQNTSVLRGTQVER